MTVPKLEVRVESHPQLTHAKLYIVQRAAFHGVDAYGVIEDGRLVFRPFRDSTEIRPAMFAPPKIMAAIVEQLAGAEVA